jgi:hypothetical protein
LPQQQQNHRRIVSEQIKVTLSIFIEVTNVKLESPAFSIPLFGELTIADYLVSEANKLTPAKKSQRLT